MANQTKYSMVTTHEYGVKVDVYNSIESLKDYLKIYVQTNDTALDTQFHMADEDGAVGSYSVSGLLRRGIEDFISGVTDSLWAEDVHHESTFILAYVHEN